MMSPSSNESTNASNNRENQADNFRKMGVDDTGMHSLGEALAGVNIGTKSPGGATFGASAVAAAPAPFAIGGSKADNDGWGNFASESATFPVAAAREQNESIQLFLSRSPSQTLGDDVFKLSHPNLPALVGEEDRLKNSVGAAADPTGAFRMSVQSLAPGPANNAASNKNTSNGVNSYGEIRPEVRRRTDSPSCSVTGTTTSSRSVSPYTNSDVSGSRTIQAYQRYDSAPASVPEPISRNHSSFADDDRSANTSLNHGHGSHPSLATVDSAAHRSPYAKDRNYIKSVGSGSPYDPTVFERASGFSPQLQQQFDLSSQQQQQQQQLMAQTQQQQQAQVLYMAVPSPDGRGQVLQPVQMLQLPGKPFTYVVPPGAAGAPVNGLVQAGGMGDLQNIMVLPPVANQQITNGGLAEYGGSPLGVSDVGSSGRDGRGRMQAYSPENSNRQPYGNGLDFQLGGVGGDIRGAGGSGGAVATDEYLRSVGMNVPGVTDASVASLYSTPHRPPLDALLGQVRRLSRDQVGCRLVQQALDEEGPVAATLILKEGLPFWGEAMVDPFGNYLFQKILEKVTPEERIMLVKSVSTRLVNASLNLHGTRSVQKVVELCALDEQNMVHVGADADGDSSAADVLTRSLAPAAARLCIDSHGNHVIQRILLKLGHKHSKFVFDAVAASVGDVARHRHGCCVIQRCLDSPPSEARSHLVRRIVEKSLELMQDAYGNYVVQYVLDVCADEDVHAVCESVVGKVNLLAIQKFSSNVMEKCLERCSDRVKEMYLQEMSDPERIRELMMDPFGNYVVQRALSVATHVQAIRLVEAMRPHLIATQTGGPNGQRNGGVRNTAGGRRIIAKICRRFPNFTLSAVGTQEELYSQNKGNLRHQHPSALAPYSPVGAPGVPPGGQHLHLQHYGPQAGDLRLQQGHLAAVQQQPAYYNVGANPYYDPYSNGHAGYPGM